MGINETDLDPKEVFSYKTCTLLDEWRRLDRLSSVGR
jgi:hypothetical protein